MTAIETTRANLTKLEIAAAAILEKGIYMTPDDRLQLLQFVNVAYHDGGKIEGLYSIDSSTECTFCVGMRKAAEKNNLMICGFCYAAADAKWKEAARRRHALNAHILSTVLFSTEELTTLKINGPLCRMNEDGDTVNVIMARNYIRIFQSHPEVQFGYFYKAALTVAEGLKAEGITRREDLPANVRFIHSSPMIGTPAAARWHDDVIFTVYPDTTTTVEAITAGAHECNGRKCINCGFACYRSPRGEKAVHVAEVLRTNKARRAEILTAYNALKAAAAGNA